MAKRKRKFSTAPPKTEPEVAAEMLPAEQFINRDLSWLAFNERVLHEAEDARTPLLERVGFLSIFNSNLDEFFMKRVGLLQRHVHHGVLTRRLGGLTAAQLLREIRVRVMSLLQKQAAVWSKDVNPALERIGIRILGRDALAEEERNEAKEYFHQKVFPVLTPLAVDPGHPFPFISNLSTSLGVALKHPDREEKQFARVKVPRVLPQFVQLRSKVAEAEQRYLSLADLIWLNLQSLFPGMVVLDVMPFRITRNADVEQDLDEADEAEDLLDLVEQEVRQRKFERVVRIEHSPDPDPWILQFLLQELEIAPEDVYEVSAVLDYTTLRFFAELPLTGMRYEPWAPLTPKILADDSADIFAIIRKGDLLVHHPYESFNSGVERFVEAAAQDRDVLAIKVTLYRTGEDSPFINTLIRAAEAGKQVVALIELQARFDEERNIYLAHALERAGVHVVYGVVGLKTHTKTTLVVRKEMDGLRAYAHIGTGNYHVQTAKLYTDVGILTCRPDLCEDLVDLFHFLTGRSLKKEYRKLLVAPFNMAERFNAMIQREIANKKEGKPARIVAKMNSLEEPGICQRLYAASQAGVPVDLIVRGICCLRPGVPGLSDDIRVISVIGRFLEHSRIFHFAAGAENPVDGEFYIGSADWMYRNLYARVEVIAPVEDATARGRLWEVLQVSLEDQRQAWEMKPDGSYIQRMPAAGSTAPEALGTHVRLMTLAKKSVQPGAEVA